MYMKAYIDDMARRYSIAEARAHLPAIVDDAERGHSIEITRRGRSVAVVLSPAQYEALKAGRVSFAEAYRGFRERFPEQELGLDDDFASTVRSREAARRVEL